MLLHAVALKSPRGPKFFSSIPDIRHANYFLEFCLQASCSCIGVHAPKTHGRESSNCPPEYPNYSLNPMVAMGRGEIPAC